MKLAERPLKAENITIPKLGPSGMVIKRFATEPDRAEITRRFCIEGALLKTAAQDAYKEALAKHEKPWAIPRETLEKIADLDGLANPLPLVPFVSESMDPPSGNRNLNQLCLDETLIDNVEFIIQRTNAQTQWPLLEGPPGVTKTQAVTAFAQLAKLPMIAIMGAEGSADHVRFELFGRPFPVTDPIATAKYIGHKGAFKNPNAQRQFYDFIAEAPFEYIPTANWEKLAALEGIKRGDLYQEMGKASLAQMYGCILFIDELNAMPVDAQMFINQLAENYLGGATHPNFRLVAAQNPAGPDFPSRKPLGIEVRSRFATKQVEAPTFENLYSSIRHSFTGVQPSFKHHNKQVTLASSDLGVHPATVDYPLAKVMEPGQLATLLRRFAQFHQTVSNLVKDGTLDPQNGENPTDERAVISRRHYRSFAMGLNEDVKTLQDSNQIVNRTKLQGCFNQHLEHLYLAGLSFATEIDVSDKDKGTKKKISHTRDLFKQVLAETKLDAVGWGEINTFVDAKEQNQQLIEEVAKKCAEFKVKPTAETNKIVEKLRLNPNRPYLLRPTVKNDPKSFSLVLLKQHNAVNQLTAGTVQKLPVVPIEQIAALGRHLPPNAAYVFKTIPPNLNLTENEPCALTIKDGVPELLRMIDALKGKKPADKIFPIPQNQLPYQPLEFEITPLKVELAAPEIGL